MCVIFRNLVATSYSPIALRMSGYPVPSAFVHVGVWMALNTRAKRAVRLAVVRMHFVGWPWARSQWSIVTCRFCLCAHRQLLSGKLVRISLRPDSILGQVSLTTVVSCSLVCSPQWMGFTKSPEWQLIRGSRSGLKQWYITSCNRMERTVAISSRNVNHRLHGCFEMWKSSWWME